MSALLCFLGWTWVHFYWEGPGGVLLWHDTTYQLANKLGIDWDRFVGSGSNDGLVQIWRSNVWWLFLGCTILCFTAKKQSRVQRGLLIAGSGLLIILCYALYLSAQKQLPMFIEHGGQMLAPILLVLALRFGPEHRATVITAMVGFILTFAGHGIYALGSPWPTPSNFYAMPSLILGLDHESTRWFLRIAGILDFAACIGICIPAIRIPAAAYGVAWGLATALARPMAGMSTDLNYWGADQFIHQMILRAPHFLIPLFLVFLWVSQRKPANDKPASQ